MKASQILTYLEKLEVLMQAQPPKVAEIKALLERARQDGYSPASLYLSAMKLHPWKLGKPPDPRELFEAPAPADPAPRPCLTVVSDRQS